ncbi:hypothetical protein F2P81_025165 [Scophthalmus maximus]|uniref:Major facilitator superfamily (MFS) profile domain-containing protein n=1 Tax=Scophthalmus maximus TaxID=52904 RepID=A0A6A4RQL0_SCOMX|nr:hypothetical protein F2P81_025165 [Scophthalmus maximus]
MSSITFPAVSALVSHSAAPDQQGVAQGMITGIRGLCNGLGPALYGFIFFLFNVELDNMEPRSVIPGPPFLFGACAVLFALLVAVFIPEHQPLTDVKTGSARKSSGAGAAHAQSAGPLATPTSDMEDIEPLLQDSSMSNRHIPGKYGDSLIGIIGRGVCGRRAETVDSVTSVARSTLL